MGKVKDSFFGGAEKSAAGAAVRGGRFAIQQQQFGKQQAVSAIKQQARSARRDISGARAGSIRDIRTGIGEARRDIRAGIGEARGDITAGTELARGDITGGLETARGDITSATQQAVGSLDPFREGGLSAFEEQQALLGLSGEEAGASALARFQESPGQDFLREEQERAVLRNAAATGGTRGGNVLKELQRSAFGRSQLDFANNFQRLQQLGIQGQQAAGDISGLFSQEGINLANLETGASTQLAQLAENRGTNLAQISQTGFQNLSRLAESRGTNIANIRQAEGQSLASLRQFQGSGIANAALGTATQLADIQQNIGAAQAAGITGQAAGFRSGLRETVSLASGAGGFGFPGNQQSGFASFFAGG